jgi:hypothetical protein
MKLLRIGERTRPRVLFAATRREALLSSSFGRRVADRCTRVACAPQNHALTSS